MAPREEIKEEEFTPLLDNGVRESKTLEYKRELPGSTDNHKREFLADVASFANTAGGTIIYGMESVDGAATGLPGLEGINPDAEILRLESTVLAGIEPRIPGISSQAVPLENGRHAIVLFIPKSWAGPHMVTYQGSSKFYARNSAGKYPLDVQEIRQAFLLSETVRERIRSFRLDRIGRLIGEEAPVPLPPGGFMVLHSIPLSAFQTATSIELPKSSQDLSELMRVTITSGNGTRYNLDGVLAYYAPRVMEYKSYVQLFRDGVMEVVDKSSIKQGPDGQMVVYSGGIENAVVQSSARMVKYQRRLGLQGPVLIFLALLRVKGYWLRVPQRLDAYLDDDAPPVMDRDSLIFPEVLVEYDPDDWATVLRPLLDMLWNSAGWPGSRSYDKNGDWNPMR